MALLATQALAEFGIVDLSRSIYLTASIGLGGAIIGGLMFGVGMALVGTCGFGSLVRVGGGDLRAIVVFLVLGLSALATMRGVTGMLRVLFVEPLSLRLGEGTNQALTSILCPGAGAATRAILVASIATALVVWALADGKLIRSPRLLVSGFAVGGAIAFGWFATGWLADDEFDPIRVSSLTFVAPLGDSILYVATFSGRAAEFRHRLGRRRGRGLVCRGDACARLPLGGLRRRPRIEASHDWRAADGRRRHNVDGMHHRTGPYCILDAGGFSPDHATGDRVRRATRAGIYDDRRMAACSAKAIRTFDLAGSGTRPIFCGSSANCGVAARLLNSVCACSLSSARP
ncbi:hypothetical protein ACVWY2_000024 [Bradyrhizobium sp. JR6.1]